MRHITKAQLIDLLTNLGSAAIVGCQITTETVPRLVGATKPKGVVKVSTIGCTLNAIYQNRVNKRLAQEGQEPNFETAGDPGWKQRVNRLLSVHRADKSQYYVDYMPEKVHGEVVYLQDGKPIAKGDIAQYIPQTADKGERQGLSDENVVEFRHCKLDSIKAIQIKGETYVVT